MDAVRQRLRGDPMQRRLALTVDQRAAGAPGPDDRIASKQAKFGFVFARRGLVPEATSSWFLPRVAGIAKAMEWVATGRVRHGEAGPANAEDEPPPELTPRERMRWRLNTPEGRALYARRKVVVEPVNGQIKHARGFRQFSFRGLAAVEAEWHLVSLCHNLLKVFTYRACKA